MKRPALFVAFAGVTLLVGLFQVNHGEAGIVPHRLQGLMPHQILDVIDVGPAAQKFRGATAAEGVRRDKNGRAQVLDMIPDDALQSVIGRFPSEAVEEDGRFVSIRKEIGPDSLDIGFQKTQGRAADRHNTLFVALAGYGQRGVGVGGVPGWPLRVAFVNGKANVIGLVRVVVAVSVVCAGRGWRGPGRVIVVV